MSWLWGYVARREREVLVMEWSPVAVPRPYQFGDFSRSVVGKKPKITYLVPTSCLEEAKRKASRGHAEFEEWFEGQKWCTAAKLAHREMNIG